MLRRLLKAGPLLSQGIVRLVACAYALFYLMLYIGRESLLPEFIFRDAEKIQAQMEGSSTYAGTSFDAVGKIYGLLGTSLLNALVAAVGVCFIWMMLNRAYRPGLMVAALWLSAPCVLFNLFVASKDTLVVFISMVLIRFVRRHSAPWRTFAMVVVLYGMYAAMIRSYFALIMAIAIGIFLISKMSPRWRLAVIAVAVIAFCFLPDQVYFALLSPRDMAVDYLVYASPYGAKSSFYNLVPPVSLLAFVLDYAYAVVRLNFAWLFSPGIKEVLMQGFVILAVWGAWKSLRNRGEPPGMGASRILGCLVIGHVGTSMLFEPDLGSYVRHLSSVALFSMVLLSEWAAVKPDVRMLR